MIFEKRIFVKENLRIALRGGKTLGARKENEARRLKCSKLRRTEAEAS